MKVIVCIVCFVLANLVGYAQKECIVKGKVKGLQDGETLTFFRDCGRLLEPLATDTVRNEEFLFKLSLDDDTPECLKLIGRGEGFPNGWLELWVAPGKKVTVTGYDKLLGSWRVKSNIREQKDQNRYLDATYEWVRSDMALRVERDEMRNSPEWEKLSRKEKQAAYEALDFRMDSINNLIMAKEMEIMKKSPFGPVWLNKMYSISLGCRYSKSEFPYRKDAEELYARMTEGQKQTEKGKSITTNLFPPTIVGIGDIAADGDLYDLKGNIHHLADYRGKFMLLDFWSRGCGPCMMALPEMRMLAEKYKDKLTLVSLNTDDRKNWEEVSAKENMTWENLNDLQGENGLYAKYGVNGIPHYVVISPEGKIVHAWSGYGKGIFEMHLRKFLDRTAGAMTVKRMENGNKVVEYPDEKPGGTKVLAIDRIVMSNTATVVYMTAYYMPHYWIMISPDAYLAGDDGSQSRLVKAEGIVPGKKFWMPAEGKAAFTLTFGPLPPGVKSFDFIESNSEDAFKLFGVALEK